MLDNKRLGKQRVEAKQIYLALTDPSYGWQNHPAVKMWRGYEPQLIAYGIATCTEWLSRGFNDSLRPWFLTHSKSFFEPVPWITPAFCRSHQSNLIRKDPIHYRKFFPAVPDNLPYIWPTEQSIANLLS